MASQITSLTIVYSTVYSGADQRKHQSSASLGFVTGINRWPVNSPHKWPVTRKMFPFDDVIMTWKPFRHCGSPVDSHHKRAETNRFFVISMNMLLDNSRVADDLRHMSPTWRHCNVGGMVYNYVSFVNWNCSVFDLFSGRSDITRYCIIMAIFEAWWRHQMKTFSALLAICAGN